MCVRSEISPSPVLSNDEECRVDFQPGHLHIIDERDEYIIYSVTGYARREQYLNKFGMPMAGHGLEEFLSRRKLDIPAYRPTF